MQIEKDATLYMVVKMMETRPKTLYIILADEAKTQLMVSNIPYDSSIAFIRHSVAGNQNDENILN